MQGHPVIDLNSKLIVDLRFIDIYICIYIVKTVFNY